MKRRTDKRIILTVSTPFRMKLFLCRSSSSKAVTVAALAIWLCGPNVTAKPAAGPRAPANRPGPGESQSSPPVPDRRQSEGETLATIQRLIDAPRQPSTSIDESALKQIRSDVASMTVSWERWRRERASAGPPPAPQNEARAASISRAAKALEWALQSGDNEVLRSVAADLSTKRQDCDSRKEGLFGAVSVTIHTLQAGSEKRGLQVRYLERFYWDLLPKVPALAKEWREFGAVSAIVGEQLTAGDYVIVARSADGKDLSDAKPISVGTNKPTQFDLVLR